MRPYKEIYYRISSLEKLGRLIRKPALIKELIFLSVFYACAAWLFIESATESSGALLSGLFLLIWPLFLIFPIHFKLYRATWELAGDYFGRARELRRICENLQAGTGEFELRYELGKELERENINRANALAWVLGDRAAY
ncbi:MAG: hypothetical protein ACYS8W_10695 [Planctomycetota bacterium]|jgi:hypothetical protein